MKEVVKQELFKWLDVGIVYAISNSEWDHFPLPFIEQMLDKLAGREYYCFLDGYYGYLQILICPNDHEKTTFTCPFATYAFKCMTFGLCNAPKIFMRCMTAIFADMLEVGLDVYGDSFQECLDNLEKELRDVKRPT
ncbi:RNA-directed DNA polymerase-like protein [Gossypium australe]|uniref:RNA-directed DNA polymerase-like protein n=1 Tax=Gossypium australe TaxID=47621 RepID=A0A5B6X1D7_9ROSI|nr:RNA-directed DNA polymerase-like protein [Gossypium australe]